jgi:glycosyltransferase involved in cell wall biosynthesis
VLFDFVIPGDINAKTGGYLYDKRLIEAAFAFGVTLQYVQSPRGIALIDGLALPLITLDHPFIALIHHPLALETGLSLEEQKRLYALEKAALAKASHIIVTSPITAEILVKDYAVSRETLTVALPGTPEMPRNRGENPLNFLCIGSLIPRKNYPFLIETLNELDLAWHLDIVGGDHYDPAETAKIKAQCDHRVSLHGTQDDLAPFYEHAGVFIMPSLYEGYGMVMGEALKAGCAIISTDGGALRDTLPAGCGIHVPVNDKQALKRAIITIQDKQTRNNCREKAFQAGQLLPSDATCAKIITDVIKKVCS